MLIAIVQSSSSRAVEDNRFPLYAQGDHGVQ